MRSDCICPGGKCHLGRKKGEERRSLCAKCIDLWFNNHLRHRVEKMLNPEGAESKCIVMRSLLQFLGLSSSPNPDAKKFELALADPYKFDEILARLQGSGVVTYEIRVENLGGKSFASKGALSEYRSQKPEEAGLLARFHYGVHVHTAHLTWGANHSSEQMIWDINDPNTNGAVVRAICDLLRDRLYKPCGREREVPWDHHYGLKDFRAP